MRKAFAIIVFISCLGVLGLSSSELGMHALSRIRYQDTGVLGSDKYRFGDLYGLSYLAPFRLEKDTSLIHSQAIKQTKRDIDLTILGDSYLYSYVQMDTSNFVRAKQVVFRRWSEPKPLTLRASTNKKVLIIEVVERNVWSIFHVDRLKAHFESLPSPATWYESWNRSLSEWIYHPQLEQNLDFALFNMQVFSPWKSLKARLNADLFHRLPSDVSVSKDGQFLYMRETVDSTQRGSSFYSLQDEDMHELRDRILALNHYAHSKGFDEVVFVIIPNPVVMTKTEQRPSNQLIQRLAIELGGQVRFVDPTHALNSGREKYFFKSDSHWNQAGARAWLAQFNQYLLTL